MNCEEESPPLEGRAKQEKKHVCLGLHICTGTCDFQQSGI